MDLGAIRRSEEIIEMLVSRRIQVRALADPAVALLSSLTADVDEAAPPAWRGGPRHRARRARPGGTWPNAAAAAAVAAAIATLTAVAATVLMIAGWATAIRKPRSARYPGRP